MAAHPLVKPYWTLVEERGLSKTWRAGKIASSLIRDDSMITELGPADTDVVVLCGGKGQRLGPLTQSTPKPLLLVGERPFLFYLLVHLQRQGFCRFILATHHLSEKFQDFLAAHGELFGQSILVREEEPLGTGGAIRNAAAHVRSPFFVALNGDSYISQPLAAVVGDHSRMGSAFTMVAARAENVTGGAENKGAIEIGTEGQIAGFVPSGRARGWINAGIYVLDRAMVLAWPSGRYDLESNLMELLGQSGGYAFRSEGRLLDIGTPQCYARANQDPIFLTRRDDER